MLASKSGRSSLVVARVFMTEFVLTMSKPAPIPSQSVRWRSPVSSVPSRGVVARGKGAGEVASVFASVAIRRAVEK